MSFEFAVGDFVAVAKLIKDITSCLQSVGGAESEYHGLVRLLETLDMTLRHIDRVSNSSTASKQVDVIQFTVASCQHQLQNFLRTITKYEKSLGIWSQPNSVKRTVDKLQWTLEHKKKAEELKMHLNIHIGTINLNLSQNSLERLALADEQRLMNALHVEKQLSDTQHHIHEIKANSIAQNQLLYGVFSVVVGLFSFLGSSLQHICQTTTKISHSMQQVHTILLEMRNTNSTVDTRMTYFQVPFVVEDALGFKFPVPSEYDYDLINAIVRHRFKEGPGSGDVIAGHCELCKMDKRSETITATTRLVPGTAIVMAIIVEASNYNSASCPMLHCESSEASPSPGGGFICCTCNVWYDQTHQERYLPAFLRNFELMCREPSEGRSGSGLPHQAILDDEVCRRDNPDDDMFRNVKWARQNMSLLEFISPVLESARQYKDTT